jgi:primosomal protein N' (replication factor Y) (superfamily II helicase)
VDGGFRYVIPDHFDERIEIGSLVRVPLGGRRVRGYVIGIEEEARPGLKPIAAMSGDVPVFHPPLLETLRWAAQHYVSPLSSMLERSAPPNNPRRPSPRSNPPPLPTGVPLKEVVDAALAGRRIRPTALLASSEPFDLIRATALTLLGHGRSSLVIVSTTSEAEAVFENLSTSAPGHTVIAHGDMPDRSITGAWGRSLDPCVVVGTPRVAAWPVASIGVVFVLQDGRRAMKDRQTPTVHARDLVRHRSLNERFPLVVVGPTPSGEILATGPRVVRAQPGRLWPLVEVVDRREHSGGGQLLSDPVRRALSAVTRRGGRSFVFGHRKGYSAATWCVACRTIRRCAVCGSRPDPGEACTRCGAPLGACVECGAGRFEALGAGVGRLVAEVGRVVGSEMVVAAPGEAAVVVGTERDLLGWTDVDLVVIPDIDGLIHGTNYRSAEDALRLGARLASVVGRGGGKRMIVQTSDPSHPVVRALVKADPITAMTSELNERAAMGYPPVGELLVLEIVGGEPPDLAAVEGACEVLGPAPRGEALRWLLQASDLGRAKSLLRPLVQRWRDSGLRVRIDVDPIDL